MKRIKRASIETVPSLRGLVRMRDLIIMGSLIDRCVDFDRNWASDD